MPGCGGWCDWFVCESLGFYGYACGCWVCRYCGLFCGCRFLGILAWVLCIDLYEFWVFGFCLEMVCRKFGRCLLLNALVFDTLYFGVCRFGFVG